MFPVLYIPQPSVQTAAKESKPKIAVSSSSSSGTFSYAPRSIYPQPNTQATPSTTRDYPGNAILTHYDNVSSTASTTKDKYSATSDTIKKKHMDTISALVVLGGQARIVGLMNHKTANNAGKMFTHIGKKNCNIKIIMMMNQRRIIEKIYVVCVENLKDHAH